MEDISPRYELLPFGGHAVVGWPEAGGEPLERENDAWLQAPIRSDERRRPGRVANPGSATICRNHAGRPGAQRRRRDVIALAQLHPAWRRWRERNANSGPGKSSACSTVCAWKLLMWTERNFTPGPDRRSSTPVISSRSSRATPQWGTGDFGGHLRASYAGKIPLHLAGRDSIKGRDAWRLTQSVPQRSSNFDIIVPAAKAGRRL